jgi:parallel beta-helix repeat protein
MWCGVGILLFSAPLIASRDTAQRWEAIGQIGGPTQAVSVQGHYAYTGVGSRMVVLDVSVPGELREAGVTPPFPHVVTDIAVSGTIAYVAAGGAGLRVVDVTDPERPVEVGAWESRGYAEGVAVAGATAYLADGPYGLRAIDVSKPSRPVEVGAAFTTNYAFKVVVRGRYAYIAAAGAGLLIADISDPAHPVEVSRTALPGFAYGLAVADNTAYVAAGWEGLQMVNVADATRPAPSGGYKTTGLATAVGVSGSLAYLGDSYYGLLVLEVSNPALVVEMARYRFTGGHVAAVALAGSRAYLAEPEWGLRVADIAASQPVEVGSYSSLGSADAVAVSGDYAYVAAGISGFRIVDISDIERPTEVGAYDTGSYATSVAVAGNYAYVCGANPPGATGGVHVVDIRDPRRPLRVGHLGTSRGGPCRDMALDAGIVYEVEEWGLRVIDVSHPATPTEIGYLGTPSTMGAVGVAVSGNTAYLAVARPGPAGSGLLIVDISRPTSPAQMGWVDWPNAFAQGVSAANGRAYVADTGRLTVIDVSDPRHPAWLASLATSGFEEYVNVDGHTAYVADGGAGFTAIDVSGASPMLMEGYNTAGYAQQVIVRGEHVFVADMDGGLLILGRSRAGGFRPPPRQTLESRVAHPVPATTPGGVKETRRAGLILGTLTAAVAAGASCLVSSASDSGGGTLRAYLETALPGTIITFDTTVFPPSQPVTISLVRSLPYLTQGQITIDASGAGVILSGRAASAGTAGLNISSSGNRVMGLQIVGFPEDGIFVGEPSSGTRIGGDRTQGAGPVGQGNRVSGNAKHGIQIWGKATADTVITGNLIGTDLTGTVAEGNGTGGIFVADATGTRIGGVTAGERNIISGNGGAGIEVSGTRSLVIGNYVGTDVTGTHAVSNGGGIGLTGPENQVGGSSPPERNVLSGNRMHGIGFISERSYGNIVAGNYIGVDASGTRLLSNQDHGVSIEMGANHNLVRNNVIVTTGRNGVLMNDAPSSFNTIAGNIIGADATGRTFLGRGYYDVQIGSGAAFNRIGGTTAADRNVIVGGVTFGRQGSPGNLVIGNFIGTDSSGAIPLASRDDGVKLADGTQRAFIGGTTDGERNVISGFPGAGIRIQAFVDYNFIGGNWIGTEGGISALGNRPGIQIDGGERNVVQANVIANNWSGVVVAGGARNTIRQNRIFNNHDRGIDLAGGNQVPAIALVGGNRDTPPPVITAVTANGVSGSACARCEVEVFSDAGGQGHVLEGVTVADWSGAFQFTKTGPLAGPNVTATATNLRGNSSEFSVARAVPKAQ